MVAAVGRILLPVVAVTLAQSRIIATELAKIDGGSTLDIDLPSLRHIKNMHQLVRFAIAILALVLVMPSTSLSAGEATIVDGDTLVMDDTTIRLHGIDTPEHSQTCASVDGGEWQCGKLATQKLIALTEGQTVVCDHRGLDEHGRVIAVCSVGEIELNAELVRSGYAWAFRKYSGDYVGLEAEAKSAAIGIWQAPTQTAAAFRKDRWAVEKQVSPEGCPIKGNISGNGRIYHTPWSRDYHRTRISEERGERWFCSEEEALKAGWRAPRWGS
ncbi:thermonuclease family protein [Tepidamorphus sp. 3E244]|uniref:thermonuclease family protein n=1 Tax=Tepidamorphus sp. 3E244 TaxID=3385498 RepID=UPI0038FD2784